ncbi:Alcohol dehydrogenase GroES-like domain-containing protein [Cladophialophora immunda]|nr:Alcohol dehydrogenase GroES-like domain-containing protein [Cladophialophora immunda]
MLEAIVQPSLEVEIVQSPVPRAGEGELLIKVICTGCNPKDWKSVVYSNKPLNSGDDIAGIVEQVGEKVVGFRKGDRVAAFHQMRTAHGSFAEYAIAPAHTTLHLPDQVSFEEAATIPLAAFTAAVGLYHCLQLTPPWEPATARTPLIVYGASSAVGAFVLKLACRSNIHPIIAIAGNGHLMVEKLIDRSKGDVVVDYREGEEHLISRVHETLAERGIDSVGHAFDCISEHGSPELMARLLAPNGHATFVLLEKDYSAVAKKILTSLTYVGYVHTGPFPVNAKKGVRFNPDGHGHDFGAVYSSVFARGLADGWLTAHPYQIVANGLRGLPVALKNLQGGRASAKKYMEDSFEGCAGGGLKPQAWAARVKWVALHDPRVSTLLLGTVVSLSSSTISVVSDVATTSWPSRESVYAVISEQGVADTPNIVAHTMI